MTMHERAELAAASHTDEAAVEAAARAAFAVAYADVPGDEVEKWEGSNESAKAMWRAEARAAVAAARPHIAALTTCSFTVYGKPISKGSMRSYGPKRIVEQIPESAPWRERVHWEARREWGTRPPIEGPVSVIAWFAFDKPKTAPKRRRIWPVTRATYDLDKLVRNIFDAISKVVIGDDSQVVEQIARKYYVGDPGCHPLLDRPGAHIYVCSLLPAEPQPERVHVDGHGDIHATTIPVGGELL